MSGHHALQTNLAYFHHTLRLLYGDVCCPHTTLSNQEGKGKGKNKKPKPKTIRKAYKALHEEGKCTPDLLDKPAVQQLITETAAIFRKAAKDQIKITMPEAAVKSIENDIFIFSGFKTYAQLKEAALLLLDENKNIKPFYRFLNDVQNIIKTYNEHYLEAEYIFATQSAMAVNEWLQFEEDDPEGKRYNLQYRTANDDKVRDTHRAMEGITLPANSPFWDKYYPPNGWRCRCRVVQVLKKDYPETDLKEAEKIADKATTQLNKKGENVLEIFRFNPGKQKVIFPPNHPYRGDLSQCSPDSRSERCKVAQNLNKSAENKRKKLDKEKEILSFPIKQQWEEFEHNPETKSKILVHKLVNRNDEFKKNMEFAKAYANTFFDKQIFINPEITKKEHLQLKKRVYPDLKNILKNPDLRLNNHPDISYIDTKQRPEGQFNKAVEKATIQGAVAVVKINDDQFKRLDDIVERISKSNDVKKVNAKYVHFMHKNKIIIKKIKKPDED
ncbi:MAG: phage head morphogenesis protein [Chitinophagaceae bacterium]|nr:phage head morphogenesis protein [Chitinophagaceae bacterium]